MKKNYDIVYSLGGDCTCARYMLKYHLRSYASPFDWLAFVDFAPRMKLIENDFKNFMNLEDLKFIQRKPGLDYLNPKIIDFEDTRNGFHFYHDFPKGQTLEESYPEVKAKYDRRIKRFLNQLKTAENPLLIWLSHYEPTDNGTLIDCCGRLTKKFNKNIDFIIIENDESKSPGETEKISLAPNIVKYKTLTKDPLVSGKIPLTARGCDKIFSEIRCKGQTGRRIRHILNNVLTRFLCLFIPYRPWRKAFKHRQKL